MTATIIVSVSAFLLLILSVLFFPSLSFGKIKVGTYAVIALIAAAILILFNLVPIDAVIASLTQDTEINPLKILALFFAMTFLSVYLDEVGLFSFLAERAIRRAKGRRISLFLILYFLTAILTVFTSNDVVILTLTPFICFFCKNAKLNPVPFLVGEFAAANTWSMIFLIGNPTNIYLSLSAGITFAEYFKVMALPTVVSGAVELSVILLLFRKELKLPIITAPTPLGVLDGGQRSAFNPADRKRKIASAKREKVAFSGDRLDLWVGIVHMAVCLVFLIISSYLNITMWLVSVCCAASLLLFSLILRIIRKKDFSIFKNLFLRLPWQLIPFVVSMFVMVVCFEYQGVFDALCGLLSGGAFIWTFGGASFISANLINNIPMSILFGGITRLVPTGAYKQAVYASVVGSNVGAFLTPIGALAGIMFTDLTKKHGVFYGFAEFIKYGAIISVPTLLSCLLTLSFII